MGCAEGGRQLDLARQIRDSGMCFGVTGATRWLGRAALHLGDGTIERSWHPDATPDRYVGSPGEFARSAHTLAIPLQPLDDQIRRTAEGLGFRSAWGTQGRRDAWRITGIVSKPLISVVIPAYNEQDNIDELGRRLGAIFDAESRYDWEAILVENGSADETFARASALNERDPRFKVLQLSRNFRMDGGLTAGLNHATGDAAVVMAGDLQDPPEVIPKFLRKWEDGYEIVYQIVTERQGTGPIRRMNSQLFYFVANKLTAGRIPKNVSDFRLVDRKVYETVNTMEERNRFVRGLFAWVGFKTTGVEAPRAPREAGVSGAHTFKVLDLAMKGIFAHSYMPLKFIFVFGLIMSGLSFVALIAMAIWFIAFGVPFAGFGTIVSVIVLMFGILFTVLGLMAEYIGLIYEEVKQRPNFVVRAEVGFDDDDPTSRDLSSPRTL